MREEGWKERMKKRRERSKEKRRERGWMEGKKK